MNKCKNVHTPRFYERKSPKEHESEKLNPDKNGKIIDIGHKVIRTNLYSLLQKKKWITITNLF